MKTISFLVLIHLIMAADFDPNISNGTCYYRASDEAPSRFIPCGNAAGGHVSCCESQDMCLSNRACYNGQFGVTYLAGCTDPFYSDSVCPDKGEYADQTWAGLVYCNGTSNEWVACRDSGATVTVPDPCWCQSTSRTVAFTDGSILTNIMSLPTATGLSVTWQGEFALQATLPATSSTETTSSIRATATTSDSGTTSQTTLTTALSSTTSTAPSNTTMQHSNDLTLSPGERVGIGVGIGAGSILLVMAAWLFMKWYRKRHTIPPPPTGEQVRPISIMSTPPSQNQAYDPAMTSPVWKSELPAEERYSIISPSITSPEVPQQFTSSEHHLPYANQYPYRPRPPYPAFPGQQIYQDYQPYRPSIPRSLEDFRAAQNGPQPIPFVGAAESSSRAHERAIQAPAHSSEAKEDDGRPPGPIGIVHELPG